MADILIKGMEMPKEGCHHTLSIYSDGSVEIGRRNNYRAIELPPHGRLIDADALQQPQSNWHTGTPTEEGCFYNLWCEGHHHPEPYFGVVVNGKFSAINGEGDLMPLPPDLAVWQKITPYKEASYNNDDDHSYEMQSDMRDYCKRYEPTYNPEDGSM